MVIAEFVVICILNITDETIDCIEGYLWSLQ